MDYDAAIKPRRKSQVFNTLGLLPNGIAEVDIVLVGKRACCRARSAAKERPTGYAPSRDRGARGTRTGTNRAARDASISGRTAASREEQDQGRKGTETHCFKH